MNVLLSSASRVRFRLIRKLFVLLFILLGMLPGQVFAQFACNAFLEIGTTGSLLYDEGDTVTMAVEVGAGVVNDGGENTLTIEQFHFGTDCAIDEDYLACNTQGNTITYVPGSIVTDCENPAGSLINIPDPTSGLVLTFIPDNPIVQASEETCMIEFDLSIDAFAGSPPPRDAAIVWLPIGWSSDEAYCANEFTAAGENGAGFVVDKSEIVIEKSTNGVDADTPEEGPQILVGQPVVWEYVVSNTGNLHLIDLDVVDDQGVVVTCPVDILGLGESTICTAPAGVAQQDQYANVGTASGILAVQIALPDQEPIILPVSDERLAVTDPSHYFGIYPDFTIEKSSPQYPGPLDEPGTISYSYLVTNTGTMELTALVLVDSNTASAPVCGSTTLAVGEFTTCTATHEFTEEELENGGNDECGLYNLVVATVAEINGTRQDELCIPVRLPGEAVPVLSNLGLLLMASLLLLAGLMTRRIS